MIIEEELLSLLDINLSVLGEDQNAWQYISEAKEKRGKGNKKKGKDYIHCV